MATSIKLILIFIFLLGAAVASVGWYFYYRKKTDWIAVGDALPEQDEVLILIRTYIPDEKNIEQYKEVRKVLFAYYSMRNNNFFARNGLEQHTVTHWQPLPESLR